MGLWDPPKCKCLKQENSQVAQKAFVFFTVSRKYTTDTEERHKLSGVDPAFKILFDWITTLEKLIKSTGKLMKMRQKKGLVII